MKNQSIFGILKSLAIFSLKMSCNLELVFPTFRIPYLPISHILKFWACTYYCIRFQVKHILVNGKNTSFPKIFKTLNRNLKLTYYSGKIPDMTSQPHLFSLQNIVNTREDFDNFYTISRTFQSKVYPISMTA